MFANSAESRPPLLCWLLKQWVTGRQVCLQDDSSPTSLQLSNSVLSFSVPCSLVVPLPSDVGARDNILCPCVCLGERLPLNCRPGGGKYCVRWALRCLLMCVFNHVLVAALQVHTEPLWVCLQAPPCLPPHHHRHLPLPIPPSFWSSVERLMKKTGLTQ